jgi:single-strand DNA-binding protein
MAKSLNKVMLIGNVGSEPEIRTTASGKRVAKLSLATNRSFTDRSGQQQEKTEWHRLTAWDRLADLFEQYVHKGDRLYVEGSIEYSQTEDEQGKPRYWTDIVVRDMVMLSGRGGGDMDRGGDDLGGGARRRQSAPAQAQPSSPFAEDDDDLPF